MVDLKRLVISIIGDLDYDGHVSHVDLSEKDVSVITVVPHGN
jgi:hypothetical protein